MRWLIAAVVRAFAIMIVCTACHPQVAPSELPPPRVSVDAGSVAIRATPDATLDAAMPDAAMRTCNDCYPPATPITGRVFKVDIDGPRTILSVGVGEADGLSKFWRGVLVRADGIVVPGGGVKTLRVGKTITLVASPLTTGQVMTGLSVRFDPPE